VSGTRAGIGLRAEHHQRLLMERPAIGFVEVHSENFYADGGGALAALARTREVWPVSLHGVGLSLGSAIGVDEWHLDRLARLVERIDPVRISDHACFARAPRLRQAAHVGVDAGAVDGGAVVHGNDLLPIGFNPSSLDILVDNVSRVQDRLRRPLLVENLSAYLAYDDDSIAEPDFLSALCGRAGCALLLDVNNLMVNALNRRAPDPIADCCAFVDALPPHVVGEIHLAGYCETPDLVIDDHGSAVRPAVWAVYEHALQRFGAVPTLIEWDTDLPALDVLLAEAARADDRLARVGR
jgi:uncharacterized protein (UPF0276 family)